MAFSRCDSYSGSVSELQWGPPTLNMRVDRADCRRADPDGADAPA